MPQLLFQHQVDRVQDVFQYGIVVFFCVVGILPWQRADTADPNFAEFLSWYIYTDYFIYSQKVFYTLKIIFKGGASVQVKCQRTSSTCHPEAKSFSENFWILIQQGDLVLKKSASTQMTNG